MKLSLEIRADNQFKAHEIASRWLSYPHTHGQLKIANTKLDPKPFQYIDPVTKKPETRFKFSVEIEGEINPSDSRLHSLLRELPRDITAAGPIIPTGAAMALSADKTMAMTLGAKRMIELGLSARGKFDDAIPMTAERRRELGIE